MNIHELQSLPKETIFIKSFWGIKDPKGPSIIAKDILNLKIISNSNV